MSFRPPRADACARACVRVSVSAHLVLVKRLPRVLAHPGLIVLARCWLRPLLLHRLLLLALLLLLLDL